MSNKVIKPVSFNVTKTDDVKMLEFIKRKNFSGLVKKLIWQEIKRQEEKKAPKEPIQKPAEPLTAAQKLEQMKSQLKDINGTKSQE